MKKTLLLLSATLLAALPLAAENAPLPFPHLGFSIEAPQSKIRPQVAAIFYLPAADGFAANVNVALQPWEKSVEEYLKVSREEIKRLKGTLVAEKKLGENECLMEYTLTLNEQPMHFYARAVLQKGTVYLATGTSLEKSWALDGPVLKQSVNSLKLLPPEKSAAEERE